MGKKESLNKFFEEEVKIQSDLDTPEITEMGNYVSPTPSNNNFLDFDLKISKTQILIFINLTLYDKKTYK